jgi:iron-sulfur cluster assembly protein
MNQTELVTLTENAMNYIRQCRKEKHQENFGLRFGVKKTGCSGFSYFLDFIEEANNDDSVSRAAADLWVAIDTFSLPYVQGTRLDYQKNAFGGAMKFYNPNEKDSCGCGESFTVE